MWSVLIDATRSLPLNENLCVKKGEKKYGLRKYRRFIVGSPIARNQGSFGKLYDNIAPFQCDHSTVSPNERDPVSIFISETKEKPRCILKKECAFTPVVSVAGRETSPRGKHDRFYDLLSRLASSPS